MKDAYRNWFGHVELFGLYVFAFCMPTMESVKWAGLILFLMGTACRRFSHGRLSWRRPDRFEWVLILMCLTALLTTLANWPQPNGISGLKKALTYILLGWLMYTGQYRLRQMQGLLFAITAGVLAGLAWSAYDLFSGRNPFLEFQSIPNLNRSAIFHVISMFVMLGAFLDKRITSTRSGLFFMMSFVVSIFALIIMGSRGALLGFLSGSFILALLIIKKKRIWIGLFLGLVAVIMTVSLAAVVSDNPILKSKLYKFTHYYHDIRTGDGIQSVLTESERVRYDYARIAWAQITQTGHFLLGTGLDTYKHIDVHKLKFDNPLVVLKKERWSGPSHAHNEFLTRWVETGFVGLGVHLFFLGFIAVTLYRHRPSQGEIPWHWVACLGFLFTALISGMFNTVLRSEMGWLSMIVVGRAMQACEMQSGRTGS
jgi:O-antigen ligase